MDPLWTSYGPLSAIHIRVIKVDRVIRVGRVIRVIRFNKGIVLVGLLLLLGLKGSLELLECLGFN